MFLGPRLGRLARRTRCAPALLALVLLLSLPHPVTADLTLSSTDERLLRQGRILFKSEIPAGGSGGGSAGSWIAAVTTTSSTINGGTGRSSPGTRACS